MPPLFPFRGRADRQMKRTLILVALALAVAAPGTVYPGGAATLPVSAIVLPKSNCRFSTPAATLNFGNLDSGSPVDVNATTTLLFRCNGGPVNVIFTITDDDGMYASPPAAHRMQHETDSAYTLPYSIAMNPSSGIVPRNTNQTLRIDGTVRGSDYASVLPGLYSDTVVLTIVP